MVERALGGAIGGAAGSAAMNDPRRRGGPHYATDWRAAGVGATWGAVGGAIYRPHLPRTSTGGAFDSADRCDGVAAQCGSLRTYA